LTDEEILAQIPAAIARAERSLRTEPHAKAARYVRSRRSLHISLLNGSAFEIPVALIEGLSEASDRDLAKVKVGPAGVALRWERLDQDMNVVGLARIAFGRRVLLQAAGAELGAARSPAKTRAARLNGRKGGRPPKSRRKSAA
jgi:hypothetical protein